MTVTYELLEEYTGTRSQEMPDPDNEGETITSEVDCRDISVRFTSDTSSTGTVFWAWAFNSAAVSYTAPQLSGTQWQINVGGQYYGYPSTATITSTSSTARMGLLIPIGQLIFKDMKPIQQQTISTALFLHSHQSAIRTLQYHFLIFMGRLTSVIYLRRNNIIRSHCGWRGCFCSARKRIEFKE